MGITYVCVTHQEASSFSVYQGKGCPANKSRECFEYPFEIAEDVQNLRNKMKYENGPEIVLIQTFVSDLYQGLYQCSWKYFTWMLLAAANYITDLFY